MGIISEWFGQQSHSKDFLSWEMSKDSEKGLNHHTYSGPSLELHLEQIIYGYVLDLPDMAFDCSIGLHIIRLHRTLTTARQSNWYHLTQEHLTLSISRFTFWLNHIVYMLSIGFRSQSKCKKSWLHVKWTKLIHDMSITLLFSFS